MRTLSTKELQIVSGGTPLGGNPCPGPGWIPVGSGWCVNASSNGTLSGSAPPVTSWNGETYRIIGSYNIPNNNLGFTGSVSDAHWNLDLGGDTSGGFYGSFNDALNNNSDINFSAQYQSPQDWNFQFTFTWDSNPEAAPLMV